jgi:hypothetical protein
MPDMANQAFMKTAGCIGALLLTASLLDVSAAELQTFDAQNYPGQWTLTTNQDGDITATENAIRRQGDEVFCRALSLKIVPAGQPDGAMTQGIFGTLENFAGTAELLDDVRHAAGEADIRNFIRHYRPPAVPYTSEDTAEKTGREKFECLEFAEDLVAQARAKNIPAEVVGIMFEGEATGHACAGFPTAEGRVLYFDSTPAAGEISRGAHQARVMAGEPYRLSGGAELAGGVGKRPTTQIMPDFNELEKNAGTGLAAPATDPLLVVAGESHVRANGIEYAGPDVLRVSGAQLLKWNRAAARVLAARTGRRNETSSVR